MNKLQVLWVSRYAPYDSVRHAGGKIHNYYLKGLYKTDKFDLKLITFASSEEMKMLDLDDYGIHNFIIKIPEKGIKGFLYRNENRVNTWNIVEKYANVTNAFVRRQLIHVMKEMKSKGYRPDVIILHWTEIYIFITEIKSIYPDVKIMAVSEDIVFLGYKRKYEQEKKVLIKYFKEYRYQMEKRLEVCALNAADFVITNNHKDHKIIVDNGVNTTIWVWCPYYQSMMDIKRNPKTRDIVFFGAMNREENWKSAIWFIEKVFSKIEDQSVKFLVIGNNPPECLTTYHNERIRIMGFVEDIEPYFSDSLCLVAPLVLGAGIKIKVLEAMSAGLPVLTNSIGIEGIPAENGKHYFHCEKPEEYLSIIRRLIDNGELQNFIEKQSKLFIREYFDYRIDIENFENILYSVVRG
jgi:glycosyltransferase involved in cell wall biosynthesis